MKFSIRDIMLVTVIVALAVGWCVHQRRLKSELFKERWFRFCLVEMAPTQTGYRMWRETLPLPNPSAPAPNPPKD